MDCLYRAVGTESITDVTKMSYTIETETMIRSVVDEFGKPDVASKQWLFDRMIKQKEVVRTWPDSCASLVRNGTDLSEGKKY